MSTSAFDNKSIRWYIYSYVSDIDLWKTKFDNVLQHLIWKVKFTNEVLVCLRQGARYIYCDENGPCLNCYEFGDWLVDNANYSICMYHDMELPNYWMSYREYKNNRLNAPESFDEYRKVRLDKVESFPQEWETGIGQISNSTMRWDDEW